MVPNAKVDLFLHSSTNPPGIHLRMQPGLLSNSAEFRIAQYDGGNTFTDRLMVRANGDFEVTANALKPGGGSWAMSSDARLKHHVTPLAGTLRRLLSLRGVSFECLTPDPAKRPPGVQLGFVTQEVQQVFPDWVGADSEGYLTVASRGFEALTVEAQRELRGESATIDGRQDARIAALEARNAELAADNQALRAESEALQRRIEQIEAPMVACGGLAR